MSATIKSVNIDTLNETVLRNAALDPEYDSGFRNRGVAGDTILEPLPLRIKAPCEHEIQNGNSWIVLGRDRTMDRASGYGGKGHTQASSIDIVVGMGNPVPDPKLRYDPNPLTDGARIYLSQKADIDEHFGITPHPDGGKSELNSKGKSGIAIKADAVRLIGTEGIKLVTRTQNQNSKSGFAPYAGIELIACNDDKDLQKMVKGDNLIDALDELQERINELNGIVLNLAKTQAKAYAAIMSHTHQGVSPSGPVQTIPAAGLVGSLTTSLTDVARGTLDAFSNRINTNYNWKQKYLNPASNNYICSKYNKVN